MVARKGKRASVTPNDSTVSSVLQTERQTELNPADVEPGWEVLFCWDFVVILNGCHWGTVGLFDGLILFPLRSWLYEEVRTRLLCNFPRRFREVIVPCFVSDGISSEGDMQEQRPQRYVPSCPGWLKACWTLKKIYFNTEWHHTRHHNKKNLLQTSPRKQWWLVIPQLMYLVV